MLKRLADYKWSSDRVFADAESSPEWLEIELILSQVGGEDSHMAYRRKV